MRARLVLCACLASLAAATTSGVAQASAKRGLVLASRGDCVRAVPELEKAEAEKHTPETAVAMARCLVVLGEIVRGSDVYRAVADEPPQKWWSTKDHAAQKTAKQQAPEVEARVARLLVRVDRADAADFQITIDGKPIRDLGAPVRVAPDVKVAIEAFAEGFRPFREEVLLHEGERRDLRITLVRDPDAGLPADAAGGDGSGARGGPPRRPGGPSQDWIGARFRGVLLPQFMMEWAAEGGTTIFVPGGGLTYTRRTDGPDVTIGVQYAAYLMGATPFKPHGAPDTEWEIVESELHTSIGTFDLMWRFPLDDEERVELRLGGGAGVGIAFAGDLLRWQAFPPAGKGGDPYLWEKCRGPNDPAGTFRYCNQLDKDATRYGQPEPYWHEDGLRPLFFPWVSLPQIGLTVYPTRSSALDLEVGATLNGLMTSLGMRVGL